MVSNTSYRVNVDNISDESVISIENGTLHLYDGKLKVHIGNEIKEITTTISSDNIVFINNKSDFPTPISGVITLEDNVTYFILSLIDLTGDRLVGGENTTIIGGSSENCILTSTGLTNGVALLSTEWTTPIRNISISDVDTAIAINGNTNPPLALDWDGVNFVNVPNIGTINTCDNFIFTTGSFLNSQGLKFNGTIGTIGIFNSLLRGDGTSGNIIEIMSTATITRRFRTTYSSIIVSGSTGGINVDALATIPTEGFILDTVSFSGGSTYLVGLNETSNDSLFSNCTGIINTAVNGQAYMLDNATSTTIPNTTTFVKVAGTTIASADNSKYNHSTNRLTCAATVNRKYLIQCTLSFSSLSGNVCEFGFYDSKLAEVRTPSRTKSTANASGRAENIHFACVVQHSIGDYLEIWCRNTSSTTAITVSDMNFLITEIK